MGRKFLLLGMAAVLTAGLALASCSSSNKSVADTQSTSDTNVSTDTTVSADTTLDVGDFQSTGTFCGTSTETLLFHLHNTYRAENGKSELKCDEDLVAIARAFSQQMCDQGFFDHVDPSGTTPEDRLNAAGVQWAQWGENLLKGNPNPLNVMNSWTASEDNKSTILGDFERLGLGYSECNGQHYWTALFVR